MPAFELAVRQGADTLDRAGHAAQRRWELVVFHDDTTERWDGQKRMAASTLAELQQLSIGGERVATLAEVCALARERQVRLNVELKGAGFSADVARISMPSALRN